MRRSPASASGRAIGLEPGAVGGERDVGAEAGPAGRTRSGRPARTVGSPPVSRIESMPKRSTHTRATRSISSKVSSSERGSQSMPSAGMQYVQR